MSGLISEKDKEKGLQRLSVLIKKKSKHISETSKKTVVRL